MPKYWFVKKDFESRDPKIHGPRNYLQSFYLAALIDKFGTNKSYALEMFRNGTYKNTRSSYKGTMNYGTPLLSFDSEMESKIKKSFLKNCHATFDQK